MYSATLYSVQCILLGLRGFIVVMYSGHDCPSVGYIVMCHTQDKLWVSTLRRAVCTLESAHCTSLRTESNLKCAVCTFVCAVCTLECAVCMLEYAAYSVVCTSYSL